MMRFIAALSALPVITAGSLRKLASSTTGMNNGDIEFTFLTAEDLVLNYLQDPNGLVEFRNIKSSSHACFALYSNGHSAGVNNETGQYLIPDSGVILSTGNPIDFNGQDSDEATTDWKLTDGGDEDLQTVLPQNINGDPVTVFDACYLEFEFRCPEETDVFTPRVNFDYVFASEEYYEYVFSKYNDAFGFFLNKENIAKLPESDVTVTINNVNHELNSEYFIGNELEGRNPRVAPYTTIEPDGFTTELTAIAEPTNGWNEIKLTIGDVGDSILDSWVLLEGGTFGCKERTKSPTVQPTQKPSTQPTGNPTESPTPSPTNMPTAKPSNKPTKKPTQIPTAAPSSSPSQKPTKRPTMKPTASPSSRPSLTPTSAPSEEPTSSPSVSPSSSPSLSPTQKPTPCPHPLPTSTPSDSPSETPSDTPSESPTYPYACGLLPCDRRNGLKEFYSTISDPSLLETPGTPQWLAFDWIVYHDQMMVCPNDPNVDHITQRFVLAVFYYATQGYKWNSCWAPKDFACEGKIAQANQKCDLTVTPHFEGTRIGGNESDAWLSPSHECSWGGIACHGKRNPETAHTIDQIELEANNLSGEIPEELAYLKNLRFLYLEQGSMHGIIPSCLGSLSQLHVIDLDFNRFSGNIPNEFYQLSQLRTLDLDHNELTGTLSTEIGLLTELQILQIDNNLFKGTIPKEIGQLERLNVGFFSYNDFVGKIDQEICALREPEGHLEMLQVDCHGEVECECCSSCRQPDEQGERKLVLN